MTKSFRKFTAVCLAVMLAVSSFFSLSVTAAETAKAPTGDGGTIYLDASACTNGDEAWYAWTWGTGTGKWVAAGEGVNGYLAFDSLDTNVVFARMDPSKTAAWENVYNQTNDATLDDNLYVIDGWGDYYGDKLKGHWGHYEPDTPGPVTGTDTAYLDARNVTIGDEAWYAWTWADSSAGYWADSSAGYWAEAEELSTGVFKFEGVCGNIVFARMNPSAAGVPRWNDIEEIGDDRAVWNQTDDLTLDNEMFVVDGWGDDEHPNLTGHWSTYEISSEPEIIEGDKTVFLNINDCNVDGALWYAWTWAEGGAGYWCEPSEDEYGYLKFEKIADNVVFARMNPAATGLPRWNEYGEPDETRAVWSQTDDLTVDDEMFIVGWGDDEHPNLTGYWSQYVIPTEPEIIEGNQTVYLDASACTSGEEIWYAWTWAEGGAGYWCDGIDDESGYLKFEKIADYVIFARMNPDAGVPRWNDYGEPDETKAVWNQTDDLTVDDNLFVIEGWGTDEYPNLPGYWSQYEVLPTDPTETETETEPEPTEPDEDTSFYVSARSNINTVASKVKTTGDNIAVTYTLKASEPIVDGMLVISYDTSKLTLDPQYNKKATMLPVISDAIYNLAANGNTVKITFSNYENKYDFTGEQVLVSLIFTKKTPETVGTAVVNLNVTDLTGENTPYVNNGVITGDFSVTQTVSEAVLPDPEIETDPTANLTIKATADYTNEVQTVDVNKNTVRVTYKLTAPEIIAYGKGVVTYDSSKLALESRYNTAGSMFSVLRENAVYNLKTSADTMMFDFTGVNAETQSGIYDFRNGGDVITLVFTVKSGASGTADVHLQFTDLGSIATDYYENGEKKAAGVSGTVDIQGTEATEPPSEPSSETSSETQSESQTETQSESQTEPQSESQTEPQSESGSDTEPQSESHSETQPQSESQTEPQTETQTSTEKPTETTVPKNPTAKQQEKALKAGANAEYAVSVLKNTKTDEPSGTVFQKIKAKASKVAKTSVKLTWSKVSGATGYIIMGNMCGKTADGKFNAYKKIKTITKGSTTSFTVKKISGTKVKKNKYYKFILIAVKGKKVLSTSKTIHVATAGGKYTNAKSLTVNSKIKKDKITLKKGKSISLKAKVVKLSKKQTYKSHRVIKYETSKKSVATVSKKGKITAKKKGTAYIYAYAQNGVFRKIKVTVK